jgi:hypothetical protein
VVDLFVDALRVLSSFSVADLRGDWFKQSFRRITAVALLACTSAYHPVEHYQFLV